jgi:TonB-linked SusC/RagA family outer membrane protein
MKKIGCRTLYRVTASVIKCLLVMKMIILLICFFSLQSMANEGFAQESITLKLENASLRKAFNAIERQTSFRFVYKDDALPANQKITISVEKKPVNDVMKKLLENTSLSFKIVGLDLIVITVQAKEEPGETVASFVVITGKVTGTNEQPLPNVSILEKGTNNGTVTKDDGSFSLNVLNTNAVLVISYVGFTTQEVSISGRSSIAIQLKEDTKELNQVVVVGYGTQKRSDITGSVSSVPKARLSQLPVTNILQAVEGAVAGVTVTQTSSVPGSTPVVLIRGQNSISANSGPYIVVDGLPLSKTGGSINDINPNDIASIEILKDASAVAIYGTNGSNGVILITTKRGTTGKPVIRYSGYTGFENIDHNLKPLTGPQYVQKYADFLKQVGQTQTSPVPNASELPNYQAGKTKDWIKEVTQQGIIQDHNLSISGGTKDVRYFISGEYMKQKGDIKGYQYHRSSLRSNLDINVTDYLTVGTSLFLAGNNYDGGRANLLLATAMSPYAQEYNADGTYAIYPMYPELLYTNPLLGLYTDQVSHSANINGNGYAEFKIGGILKGLKYRLNVGYSYLPTRGGSYTGRNANNTLGGANVVNSETNSYTIENILSYSKDWKKHHIDFTGLYSAQERKYFTSNIAATGFINDLLSFDQLGAAATVSAGTITINGVNYSGSYADKYNLLSQMGRINYSYDSRYLFTVTARRDGSSVFGANTTKYGVFPSFAVGWNVSNENFMKNVHFVDNLKLRVSYGKSGNEAIPVYGTVTTDNSVRFPFTGLSVIGVLAGNLGNANLHWESTVGTNVGIDFTILKSRITGTIDAYKTSTKGLLLRRNLPIVTGYSSVLDNLGETSNKGIEITLSTKNIDLRDFRWESMINFSTNQNKIVDLYGDKKSDVGNRWFIGKPISVVYDYKMQGIWQTGEDASKQDPGAKPGDLKFADVNGDGKISADLDKVILGQSAPKWTGGITNTFHYKNWHLNIFIQTAQGMTKTNSDLNYVDESGRRNTPAAVGYWTVDNKNNTRPALSYTNTRGYSYPSDASYTRIKDITLSFTVPDKWTNRARLGSVTVYASGRNLHTFTNWIGWDPENNYQGRGVGDWVNNYPTNRSVVFGINVSLR